VIFSIAMSGTLKMRLATGDAMLHGGSESTDGEMVFELLAHAENACDVFNSRKRRGPLGQWIVCGVDATWSGSTVPFTKTACEFPTARALKRKARIIPLNFVHGAEIENKNVIPQEPGAPRECEVSREQSLFEN
jgi:hypothetical protein